MGMRKFKIKINQQVAGCLGPVATHLNCRATPLQFHVGTVKHGSKVLAKEKLEDEFEVDGDHPNLEDDLIDLHHRGYKVEEITAKPAAKAKPTAEKE